MAITIGTERFYLYVTAVYSYYTMLSINVPLPKCIGSKLNLVLVASESEIILFIAKFVHKPRNGLGVIVQTAQSYRIYGIYSVYNIYISIVIYMKYLIDIKIEIIDEEK